MLPPARSRIIAASFPPAGVAAPVIQRARQQRPSKGPASAHGPGTTPGKSGLAAPSASYVPPLLRGPRGIAASAQDLPKAQLQWGQTRRPAGTGMPQERQRRNPGIAPRRLSQSATRSTATPTTTKPIETNAAVFTLTAYQPSNVVGRPLPWLRDRRQKTLHCLHHRRTGSRTCCGGGLTCTAPPLFIDS